MVGRAGSTVWGCMADRFGGVRVMCRTILRYSVGTAMCGIAPGVAWFALFRFLAGFGGGGEWAAGTPLLHQSLAESRRVRIAGFLHTATPVGGLRAAGAAFLVPVQGRRGLVMIGRAPALMALWLRPGLAEPPRSPAARPRRAGQRGLFHLDHARVTRSGAGMMACIILGLWSATLRAPTCSGRRPMWSRNSPVVAGRWPTPGTGHRCTGHRCAAC